MHVAAAVECKPGQSNRGCVDVAGGREPATWEAYPDHQFIHTIGQLPCCADGGCWRSRSVPLVDGDEKDQPENLCVDVVNNLPRCMHMITPYDLVRAMNQGGIACSSSAEEPCLFWADLRKEPVSAVKR